MQDPKSAPSRLRPIAPDQSSSFCGPYYFDRVLLILHRQIFTQARRDVLGAPIDADPLCQPRQRAAQQGVAFDVDLLAAGQTPLKILSKNTGRGEPADQLAARLRTQSGRPDRPKRRWQCRGSAWRSGADHRCRATSSSHSSACRGHNPSAPLSRRNQPLFRARTPLFQAGATVLPSGIMIIHGRRLCSQTTALTRARGSRSLPHKIRRTVSRPTRNCAARSRRLAPPARCAARIRSLIGAAILGRPIGFPLLVPLAFARAIPAAMRSWMIARSNSLNTESMPNIARPAGLVVSSPC